MTGRALGAPAPPSLASSMNARRPDTYRMRDFDFRSPLVFGEASELSGESTQGAPTYSLMDEFANHAGSDDNRASRRKARVTLEGLRRKKYRGSGTGDCRSLFVGGRFVLNNHDVAHLNDEWVVTEVWHEGRVPQFVRDVRQVSSSLVYTNRFFCAPAKVTVRSKRRPRPEVQTMETAIVVGPAAEEIYADEHGRIRVQFHWDREGGYSEKSSCWVRVAQNWAGTQWGFQFLPRIGMEVLVGFVGGNADHPVVLGSLFNAVRSPSHSLPEQKTQAASGPSALREAPALTNSRLKMQRVRNFSSLRAQRNLQEWVLHDREKLVGHDESHRHVRQIDRDRAQRTSLGPVRTPRGRWWRGTQTHTTESQRID